MIMGSPPTLRVPQPYRVIYQTNVNIFTPRISNGCNSFDIDHVSVCLLPLSCLNRQTYRPESWYVGQVEGYLGQA